ncbi:MAG: permease [Planctomycetaceae bacterium]
MKRELGIATALVGVFLFAYFVPISDERVSNALLEAFRMLQWYARNHTLACVVPAMFIAGGIGAFLSKETVLRHLGAQANRFEAYGVASVSGTVLAVCSCSVLPMFAGIYRVGAGLGPASAFLYSGPAINVMAIFLTGRVLGYDLGASRFFGSIVLAVIIGLMMEFFFRREERRRNESFIDMPEPPPAKRSLLQTVLFFLAMIAVLVFSDWSSPSQTMIERTDGSRMKVSVLLETTSIYRVQVVEAVGNLSKGTKQDIPKSEIRVKEDTTPAGYERSAWIYRNRWYFAGVCLAAVLAMTFGWFDGGERLEWMNQTWTFAKQIVPLLFGGVFVTGFVAALIPEEAVGRLVGGNSLSANLVASVIGALWYFATLTEIPILDSLLGLGMGRGPALTLLLAGPALSLPSIAVIYSVFGWKKTATFVGLVIVMSTLVGWAFGAFV